MTVFDGYARYYHLLYSDKDYGAEAQHVHEVIQKHRPGASTLMEMGCGAGLHAFHLAKMGYQIHGVDQSDSMLHQATRRINSLDPATAANLRFSQGDIRSIRLGHRFDAVVALFHVISYLPSNSDLKAAFSTAAQHLVPGGLFLFDCWYGPAVLTDQPSVRIKRMQDDSTEVLRIAEPNLEPNDNLVTVDYELYIRDRFSGRIETLNESHCMRYLFKPEVEWLLKDAGISLIDCFQWMTGRPPGIDTWGVCFVGAA